METIEDSIRNSLWEAIRSQPDALMIALSTPQIYEIRTTVLGESLASIARQTVDFLDSKKWEYDGIGGPDGSYESWAEVNLKRELIPDESLISKAGVALCLLNNGVMTFEFMAVYKNDPTCSNSNNHATLIALLKSLNFNGFEEVYGSGFWRISPFSREIFDSHKAQGLVTLAMESNTFSKDSSFSIKPLGIVNMLRDICEEYANVLTKNNFIRDI